MIKDRVRPIYSTELFREMISVAFAGDLLLAGSISRSSYYIAEKKRKSCRHGGV
jgi:hypothetical protein